MVLSLLLFNMKIETSIVFFFLIGSNGSHIFANPSSTMKAHKDALFTLQDGLALYGLLTHITNSFSFYFELTNKMLIYTDTVILFLH